MREHEDVLRFWFDRGVAGVRIDSAALLIKDAALPEVPDAPGPGEHPNTDRDAVHDVYRGWRAIADSYEGARVLVGEVWMPDADRFAAYLRPDEMHTAFNFDFMSRPWEAAGAAGIRRADAGRARAGRRAVDLGALQPRRDPARSPGTAVRTARSRSRRSGSARRPTSPSARAERARPPCSTAALPGSLYIYQGDELGLPEVEDLPDGLRQDPMYFRSGGIDPGRDGCRVPIPWSGSHPPFGFAAGDATVPWLPQPASWAEIHRGGAGSRPELDALPVSGGPAPPA